MTMSFSSSNGLGRQVYHTLGTYLRRDSSTLHPQDSLRDDLGLDSLQTIELIYQVETNFDIQIPDEDFGRLQTIGDVVSYLEERMRTSAERNPSTKTRKKPMNSPSTNTSSRTSRQSKAAQP